MSFSRIRRVFFAVAVLGVYPTLAWATLINVDIDSGANSGYPGHTYSGAAGTGSAGDVWNSYLFSDNTKDLVDASGNNSGATFVFTASGNYGDDYRPAGANIGDNFHSGNNLLDDYAWAYGTTTTLSFTMSGLAANTKYNVYLYGEVGTGLGTEVNPVKFTVNGVDKTLSNAGSFDGTFVEGREYVVLSTTSDANGRLNGTVVCPVESNAIFNGLQVSSIPEPSTIVLLGLGISGLLAYAWRKRK